MGNNKIYYILILALFSCEKNQEKKIFTLSEISDLKIYEYLDSLPKDKELVYRLDLSSKEMNVLPEIVSKLTNLQELNISDNHISELKGIDKLENLQILNIGLNDFKTFPNEITKLRQLKVLDIFWNEIKTFPETFYENNINIEELDMTSMFQFDFKINLAKIDRFRNLKSLHIGNNQIPELTIQFEKLKNLSEFGYIRQNKIELASLLVKLSNCKRLKTIYLSVNHIKKLPNEISLLDSLEDLNLYQNLLSDLPQEILNLKNLKTITLDGNNIDTLIIKDFEKKMTKTTFIY